MTRTLLVAMLLASVAPALALADDGKPIIEKSRVEVKPAGKPFKQLQIENSLGNVRIEGHDGAGIMIETHKSAPDEETLDRLRVSLVPDPDGTVRIMTAADPMREGRKQPRSAVAIDIIIHAPRDAHIDASVGSGKLDVVNMDGGGELDSASGAITVKNISGDLDTIGGEKLVASASQGKIAGRRVRARDVELTTMSGNISLEGESVLRGHIVVSSMKGDVDVRLRRQGGLVVKARGKKVDFGSAKGQLLSNGWMKSTFGQAQDPAIVELHSHHGIVRFAIVQ
jgi:hypothetical protein